MSAFLNIFSLCLGLLSWITPIFSLKHKQNRIYFSVISLSCCALALLLQLTEVGHRVNAGDLAAVMDTIHAITLAGTVMLAVCVTANLAVLLRRK